MFVQWISSWVYGLCIGINGAIPWYSLLWLCDGFNERWAEVTQSKRRRRESQGNSKNLANGMPHCQNMVVARMTHGEQRHGELSEAPGRKARAFISGAFVPCIVLGHILWLLLNIYIRFIRHGHSCWVSGHSFRTRSDERIYQVLSLVYLNLDVASALLSCLPIYHWWYVPGNRV